MKKRFLTIIFITILTSVLWTIDQDFCDQTVIVVLTPEMSDFNSNLDISFFGNFEKLSVEHISHIYNEEVINFLTDSASRGERVFRSIYVVTLPENNKAKVLEAVDELNNLPGVEYAEPNYILTPS